jgi:hypothetical protein
VATSLAVLRSLADVADVALRADHLRQVAPDERGDCHLAGCYSGPVATCAGHPAPAWRLELVGTELGAPAAMGKAARHRPASPLHILRRADKVRSVRPASPHEWRRRVTRPAASRRCC